MDKRRRPDVLPDLLIAAALFIGNLLILGPFLLTEYSSQPWNNGYVYMAISRMFRDHKWTWNRLQYAGAPFHYLYPPAFHVLTASLPFVSIGRAFHLVTASSYALVPVCLYILAVQLFGSRLLGFLAAFAYSVFPSPVYYLLPMWKGLAVPYANAPWGFVAMVGYEEAAHAFAFSFTLLAIAAAWRNRWILTAFLAAVVFLTNWPAMIGLGLALSAIAVRRGLLPLIGAVGTAYGLSAFWMTPGYFVSSTLLDRIVIRYTDTGGPWNQITWIVLGCALALALFSFWRRIPPSLALVLAWVAVLGAVIFAFTLANNHLVPKPNRYMLEFNAGCILTLAGVISLLPRWKNAVALVVLVTGTVWSYGFLSKAWTFQPGEANPRSLVSYQIADWLKQHASPSRALASGELDSTLALWSDVPQAGGTGQDVSNFLMFAAQRQITFGCSSNSARVAELWLRALNVRYFVVHESQSREYFHWFSQPEKFAFLKTARDNGAGDKIYEIPDENEAVVVDLAALKQLPPLQSTGDAAFLEAYVKWAAGKRPAAIEWDGDDKAHVEAQLGPDEAILVKDTQDRGWGGDTDPLGFMLLHHPGDLKFSAAWDVWLGRGITVLTLVLLLARFPGWKIAALAVVPAVIAYGYLVSIVPATARVAEEAFARLQPPIINAGGIVNAGGGIYSIYGLNFGTKDNSPHVWFGDREAEVRYHGGALIVVKAPAAAPQLASVSVEVNGCRGNAFTIPVSASPAEPHARL
ncbi:MAG TPA: IPT/TIG domain-containing protein [Bryobacteraceae bacterium]|nr:IPT/TIG domain-containing protein [Bryobacteraceae bacterium]